MGDAADKHALALAAASQASEAVSELLRFAREGEGLQGPFEIDLLEKLADALKMAIAIERPGGDRELVGQLEGALERFLEGWA